MNTYHSAFWYAPYDDRDKYGEKSVHNKELLCFFNNTINKADPKGSSFVAPGLLFSLVVRCHKEESRKNTIGSTGP
jgi:hypothetical protein